MDEHPRRAVLDGMEVCSEFSAASTTLFTVFIYSVTMVVTMVRFGCLVLIVAGLSVVVTTSAAAAEQSELHLQEDGTVTTDQGDTLHVRAGVDLDSFIWVAIDHPEQPIPEFQATLHLPKPVSVTQLLAHKVLAIKGVGMTSSTLVDPSTIVFAARDIQPTATVSVVVDFPKGYLSLAPLNRASVAIQELNQVWLWTSLALPLVGLVLLLTMMAQRLIDRRIPTVTTAVTTPPSPVSPALVSVLYESKIEPETIAATIIDLAHRGYLSIYNKASNFIIAKERDVDLSTQSFRVGDHDVVLSEEERAIAEREGLKPFEKILLSKLFVSARSISSKEDVKVRIGHGLFSKKVAAIYEYLFHDASRVGYFVADAARVHRRYLVAGWFLFFVGTVGFVAGAFTLPDPKYFLLFWVGLIGMAYLVVKLAPYVPLRTPQGRRELGQWLAYRQYLTQHTPISARTGLDTFLAGLPTAWALRAHNEWARRFRSTVFHRPNWYFTTKSLATSVEFVQDLDHLVSFVAESFSSVREKTLV